MEASLTQCGYVGCNNMSPTPRSPSRLYLLRYKTVTAPSFDDALLRRRQTPCYRTDAGSAEVTAGYHRRDQDLPDIPAIVAPATPSAGRVAQFPSTWTLIG